MFQFCLCNLGKSPEELQQDFLSSIIPSQIEFGNPDFLSGKSGLELAFFLYQNIEQKIEEALQEPYYPEAEYWAGFVVAYAQWKLKISFSTLFSKYPLERILANYHLMHEADISTMVDLIQSEMAQ